MQAVLVIAHKNIEHVIELSQLLRKQFEVYIHIDKKCNVSGLQMNELFNIGAHVYQSVDVRWGGWSIAEAARILFREALKNKEITYMHVISGEDYPVKPLKTIYEFYENNDQIYIQCEPAEGSVKSGESQVLWQKYYFDYDKINRRTTFGKIYHRYTLLKQTLLHVDKFKELGVNLKLYQGANWMDIPRDAVSYFMDYFDEHENVRKLFMTGYCSDEFWIQTILKNSEFESRIDGDIHRYIKWEKQYDNYPAVLDEREFSKIKGGNYHFARKFNPQYSAALIRMIDDELLS